jgi:hypothetical protein
MGKMNFSTVSLTPRDVVLLQGLYDSTVMSFNQIRRKYFPETALPTVSNRLSRLREGGLIQRLRVPRLLPNSARAPVETVFQITKPGIRELQKRTFEKVLREEPIRLNAFSVDHDVLLNDVMTALQEKFSGLKGIHGRLWNEVAVASGVNPDAVLVHPGSKTMYAVELELTLKSETRYREIVLKYRLASHFERVIYVTAHPAIDEKISKVMQAIPASIGGKPVTGKFFFVGLDALLKNPGQAILTNGNEFLNMEVMQ